MNILGIDFGLSKVGVAIATSKIAEPSIVIHYKDQKLMIEQIKRMCVLEKIEKIVVGISEGEMEKKTKDFIKELKTEIIIPITPFDETLSTLDAQRMGIEAHMKKGKRRRMEDAMAAAVMLQNYIDIN